MTVLLDHRDFVVLPLFFRFGTHLPHFGVILCAQLSMMIYKFSSHVPTEAPVCRRLPSTSLCRQRFFIYLMTILLL